MRNAWIATGLLMLAGVAAAQDTNLVGKDAPDIQTKEWINSDGRTTLADMKGEVVIVEGWKTH